MRRLRIVVGTRAGALPVLVAATLAAACGDAEGSSDDTSAGAGGASDAGHDVAGTGGSGGFGGFDGASGTAGVPFDAPAEAATCPQFSVEDTYTVDVPPDGTPAEPGVICAVSVSPVQSNQAARVTLTKYSPQLEVAQGFVAVAPALASVAGGTPTITVVSAQPQALAAMQVTNVQAVAGGWAFHAAWPGPLTGLDASSAAQMVVKASFDVACTPDGGGARLVEAITNVHLCLGDTDVEWVSSGDLCTVCRVIAEMAPSPIVPEQRTDALPLARALRLRVVPLARVGKSVVLLAENDGGSGLEYEWHASSGSIERLAADVIVWHLADGDEPSLIQAVLRGDGGAAVATWDWVEVA